MNSVYKQITTIMTYLLQQNTNKSSENKQLLLLELSNEGDVQIDAIGTWITNFSIQTFREECKDIQQSLKIFLGDVESNYYIAYSVDFEKFSNRYLTQIQAENEPVIEDCNNYLRFKFRVSKRSVRSVFPRLNVFFENTAIKYPEVKMSFSGSAKLWKEKEATEKFIKMISDSVGEIIKHNTTLEFRDEINKCLNISKTQEAIQIVQNALTNIASQRV